MKDNKTGSDNSDIFIDESKHVTDPGSLQRLRNSLYAIAMGIIFAQVMLFAFKMGSIILWYDNVIFISFLIICAILGWVVGEKFIQTLSNKSDDWWDIWGHFRQ